MRPSPGTKTHNLSNAGRPTCYACLRPYSHCLCKLLERFDAHCNILILQHPNEYRKYYSTAPLVTLSIRNSKLIRSIEFPDSVIKNEISDLNPYLLYPGSQATDCEEVTLNRSNVVLVIDGTWSEAKKIVKRNPTLCSLPQLSFKRLIRSEYRIRKQPKLNYLSTVESIAHLLNLNACANGKTEESKRYQSLLRAFNTMVERQFCYFPRMQNLAYKLK